ncbi:MAG: DUF531 domain-containing protein [Archaeoglobi archaeon]|nr:DUF531 domain-containing protein [Candidatus Mnemosynella bozhongmuii]
MIVLCLVNTYNKLILHEIHLRTIARAAPLCYAYDLHLALMDFSFWKDKEEVVRAIREYTTIGERGEYLERLHESGKFHLIEKIPAHFGEVIVTTSKPDERKRVKPSDLFEFAERKSLTFLIGLGRKGLPKEFFESYKYHFDITGKGVSLETCSAIGAIAFFASELQKRRNEKRGSNV